MEIPSPATVCLDGKRDLADVIKLKILSWEMILGYLGKPNVITRALRRGGENGGKISSSRCDKRRKRLAWHRERTLSHGMKLTSRGLKKQAVSFLIISRRNQLCRYLDQNPVKLTWDFLRPELRENKCIVFKQLNLWQIVTEVIGNIL